MKILDWYRSEEEMNRLQDQWEAAGFKFYGNCTLPDDPDPANTACPCCGEYGLFCAVWTRGEDTNSFYRCYECDTECVREFDEVEE